MEPAVVAVLAAAMYAEFEDDGEILINIINRRNSYTNPVNRILALQEREYHFRAGSLLTNNAIIGRYLDEDFHARFRMKKETFGALVEAIRPYYPHKELRGDAPAVQCQTAVMMTLTYLGTMASMDDIGDRFGAAKSTVHKEVHRIVNILCTLKDNFIFWPKPEEAVLLERQFRERAGFPGVIGAIDGCHVRIQAPFTDRDSYTDRKMNNSVILQGICTARKIFTNVSIGMPGCRNDCAALSYSNLYKTIKSKGHRSLMFEEQYHLIGDKAYPNRSWLIAPYKDFGNLTRRQKRFNKVHSKTRVVIEHTFGLLKGRWRLLQELPLKDVGRNSNFILAACILHNFCYINNDNVIQDIVTQVQNAGEQNVPNDAASKRVGDEKRDAIASML